MSLIAVTDDRLYKIANKISNPKSLGIKLFIDGQIVHETSIGGENNFYSYIIDDITPNCNLILQENNLLQTPEFAKYLRNYLATELKNDIMFSNNYSSRYNNNNDVYIHVRLGDVIHFNPGFHYYDSILSKLETIPSIKINGLCPA